MIRLWVKHSRFDRARKLVRSMNFPYEIRQTSSSQTIKNSKFSVRTSTNFLGKGILGHLIASKAEILRNAEKMNLDIPAKIPYFKVSQFFVEPENHPRKMFVSEFDLNHAYWAVAYRLGFIGEKTYRKFLTFKTKHFRLIALGMLAKRELVQTFDKNGLRIETKVKTNPLGVKVFKRISFEIANEMNRISCENEDSFRFYWFDNIFFDTTIRKIDTSYSYKQRNEILQVLYLPRRRIRFRFGEREFEIPRVTAYSRTKRQIQISEQESNSYWKNQLMEGAMF